MTTTTDRVAVPRAALLERPASMYLARTEYQRFVELLRSLTPAQWTAPTDCPEWDVRQMAAHLLGMVEMAASMREQLRQLRAARRRGGPFLDALTALQVDERESMTPEQIVDRMAARCPKAVAGRRRTPGVVRRRRMPIDQVVGGQSEPWTIGYLLDVILTRDPWMHRVDIVRATGAEHRLTADHDGVLVGDVVADWAARHGRPYSLRLTGPAGGQWSAGSDDGSETVPELQLDAVEFCRIVSGRAPGTGLLATQVPF